MSKEKYLHGFTEKEQHRLYEQARFLENKIFQSIDFSQCRSLLEVGCGVGAQTEILLRRYPNLHVTGIDFSDTQLGKARQYLETVPYAKGRFDIKKMDATDMDFASDSEFDGAYLCWVLEHIPNPLQVLSEVRRVLKPGSVVYISEVLNSTFFLEPYSPTVLNYWMKFNDIQYDLGGDPFVGAKLGNMLQSLGYANITTEVKTFHLDNRNVKKRAQMIQYWSELMLSGLDNLVEAKAIDEAEIPKFKEELKVVAKDPNAVFFYSFIQARATVT